MASLEAMGSEQTRKIWANHGAVQPYFGVKIGDMKTILKKTKKNHALALQLWDTGNSDAQYLAALMADEKKITESELEKWAQSSTWQMTAEYSVPWVTAESRRGWKLGHRWIEDPRELVATAGWASLSGHVSCTLDEKLDLPAIEALLERVRSSIHGERNRVRYTMNHFVISVGIYVAPLRPQAMQVAESIGTVFVDVGNTSCKVLYAPEYVHKALMRGPVIKKKTLRC